jgi:hypothetical protein
MPKLIAVEAPPGEAPTAERSELPWRLRHASPRRKRGAGRVDRSRLPNKDATPKIADCDIFAIFGKIAPTEAVSKETRNE